MLTLSIFFCYFLLINFPSRGDATSISTFEDETCGKSLAARTGPNGYPDGLCTPLNLEPLQSFQVVGLDPGCSVTVYGNDSTGETCSSDTKVVAQLAQCYDSSWKYYSIDGCNFPSSSSPSPTSAPLPSSTPGPTKATNLGVIVGGIIGGVVALTLILISIIYFLRRRYLKAHLPPPPPPPPPPPSYELCEDRHLTELSPAEKLPKVELYAHVAAAEMGRNSGFQMPVELPGDTVASDDKKEVNPIIMVHRV